MYNPSLLKVTKRSNGGIERVPYGFDYITYKSFSCMSASNVQMPYVVTITYDHDSEVELFLPSLHQYLQSYTEVVLGNRKDTIAKVGKEFILADVERVLGKEANVNVKLYTCFKQFPRNVVFHNVSSMVNQFYFDKNKVTDSFCSNDVEYIQRMLIDNYCHKDYYTKEYKKGFLHIRLFKGKEVDYEHLYYYVRQFVGKEMTTSDVLDTIYHKMAQATESEHVYVDVMYNTSDNCEVVKFRTNNPKQLDKSMRKIARVVNHKKYFRL